MEIKTREQFEAELKTLKENVITAIKMSINRHWANSDDKELVREICFAECGIGGNPIYRQSDEDFSTLCVDDVRLDDNENFTFTYSSELQDLQSGTEENLSIDNALDILTALEDCEIDLDGGSDEELDRTCPECGSFDVVPSHRDYDHVDVPMVYHCNECQHEDYESMFKE